MSAPPKIATQSISATRATRWPWITLALVLIALLAFGLRVYAVGWALPYTPHPDEPVIVNAVLGMLRRGDWNPRYFGYPSLYFYGLRLVFAAHLRYGLATGLVRSGAELPLTAVMYATSPGFYGCVRTLS